MYDAVARVNKNKLGLDDFDDHNINISGGINPSNDSEIKKHKITANGEYVSVIFLIIELISITK